MPERRTLRLEARRLYDIADAAAVAVRCTEGTLWLTLDHDVRDFVLEPGDSFSTAEHRRALLYALRPATFELVPTAPPAVARIPRHVAA